MTQLKTNLLITRESARQLRFEPTSANTATNVQLAIQNSIATVGTASFPASAATITLSINNVEIGIDTTASAVSVNLPSAAAWATANPNGLELVIFDDTGHADTHNITPVVSGSDVFLGGLTPLVTSPYGLIKLRPIPGTGWYLRQ